MNERAFEAKVKVYKTTLRDGAKATIVSHPSYPTIGTPEEPVIDAKKTEQSCDDMLKARAAAVEQLGPWKKGLPTQHGAVTCPVCKSGTLRFSRAGSNGHIHAACSTKGCVAWME
jgi:hypothetical protein